MIIEKTTRSFHRHAAYDIVVVGGGIAGVIAAASASQAGARVLLAEAGTFLGGVVTMGPLEALMTFHAGKSPVIAGVGERLLEVLRRYDPKAAPVADTTGYCSTILPYDSEMMKLAIGVFLREWGVSVMTETMLGQVSLDNRRITGLRFHTKTGPLDVSTRAVADCSGMGICGYLAGNELLCGGEDGLHQPVTVLGKIGGVDIPLLKEYVRQHPADFQCFTGQMDLDTDFLHLWGFTSALQAGYEQGALPLLRQEIHMMQTTRPNEVVVNYSRMNVDATDARALSACQAEGYEQVYGLYRYFQQHIPAFRHAHIVQSGYVGIRENGRVKGRRVLTRDDIVDGKRRETVVAQGAFPIDIHKPDEAMQFERIVQAYDIPMDCLRAESVDNLFLGGRCISSTFEANGSCRISATCMATGHAAGAMAAVCVETPALPYGSVSALLTSQGAILR